MRSAGTVRSAGSAGLGFDQACDKHRNDARHVAAVHIGWSALDSHSNLPATGWEVGAPTTIRPAS
jgi:hypothetical protein